MIPASRSVKTVKKIINLPDPMVLDIDRLAIGDYSKRSSFVEVAIRVYRRDLFKLYGKMSINFGNSNLGLKEALGNQYEMLLDQLRLDYDNYKKFESEDITAIGISLTEELLQNIDIFIDKNGPVKNLQVFARLAVARELNVYSESIPAIIELK